MSPTWQGAPPPDRPLRSSERVRALCRGALVGGLVFGGLALHLVLRMPERALHGAGRPWTGRLTRAVCRGALRGLGLEVLRQGTPLDGPGAIVANHGSWLDIFVLNAALPVTFVAKEEVAGWAGIGWLARATGTLFVRRERREAGGQVRALRARLAAGQRLVFFPEGTSTDGLRVLPFKPTLFAAFLDLDGLRLQPATIRYEAPRGEDARFYGWWGDMDFAPHLLRVLGVQRQGRVTVTWHDPVALEPGMDRKALARQMQARVAAGFEDGGRVETRLTGDP